MAVRKNTDYTSYLTSLERTLETYLVKKAPTLPEGWKKAIVKVLPWLVIIFLVLSLPAVFALFGISTLLLPVSVITTFGNSINYMLGLIFLIAALITQALAIPGLFQQDKKGWRLLYYSVLLTGVYNLFTLSLGSLLIGTGISLYVLFQIKNYFK